MKKRLRCVLIGFTGLISGLSVAQTTTSKLDAFAYIFDCAGQYIRIDSRSGVHSQPQSVAGVPAGAGGYDGCLIEALAFEPRQSVLYAVMPKQRRADPLGRTQDKVVSLLLPDLKAIGSIDIPASGDRAPKLRYDSASQEVSLTYGRSRSESGTSRNGAEYVLSTGEPSRLAFKMQTGMRTPEHEVRGPILSSGAYVASSGTIVDKDRIVTPSGVITAVDGLSLLSDSLRRQFQGLERIGVTGNTYLDVMFADSAAGRMLFLVGWDLSTNRSALGGGFLVYDALQQRTLSSALMPYRVAGYELSPTTPTLHLSPDGATVIVEEYRWDSSDAGGGQKIEERIKTGKIALYDAVSGSLLRTIELNPALGNSGRFIGFSLNSNFMYYASDQNLYLLDLSHGRSQSIKLPERFYPVRVVTADR